MYNYDQSPRNKTSPSAGNSNPFRTTMHFTEKSLHYATSVYHKNDPSMNVVSNKAFAITALNNLRATNRT